MSQTKIAARFTIYFEDPYWIGVIERQDADRLLAIRHIFGAEPSDQEICNFILHDLVAVQSRITAGVPLDNVLDDDNDKPITYKRMQRKIRREMLTLNQQGVRSKAQEAMQVQLEQSKQVRKSISREEHNADREYKRMVARQKAKAKHRGH